MTEIILGDIKPSLMEKLQILARSNHHSIEEEIMEILENALDDKNTIVARQEKWHPGFFEWVIGGWKGEPLVRSPQPEEQERDFLR